MIDSSVSPSTSKKPSSTTLSPKPRPQEGIRDTAESIVVALILAFVFRAFVVEAFVIPTGSMAPTLYGAHGTILCEDCGIEFAYGLRDLEDQRHMQIVRSAGPAICPNCNHANTNLRVSDERMNPERGDRILVLKWPLDLGGPWLQPARWDVTVFKDPADGTTNFIKRLVGLPNEVLMIIYGDVYTVPADRLSSQTLESLHEQIRQKHELISNQRAGRMDPIPDAVLAELDSKLRIARKSPAAQASLWFNVYDHDHPPRRREGNQPLWHAPISGTGWDASSRVLRFVDQGVLEDFIELNNGNFNASSAYNIFERAAPPVSDHRLSFVLVPQSPTGEVLVRLSKFNRYFVGSVNMDGGVRIEENPEPPKVVSPVKIQGRIPPLSVGKAVRIAFENVDYRLSLHVDGKEVLSSSSDAESAAYYAPNVGALRLDAWRHPGYRGQGVVPPRIIARGGDFELLHLLVQRDVHYFTEPGSTQSLPWAPVDGWGGVRSPILMRDGEYFMLGDNTAASKDSRLWDQIGPHLASRGNDAQLGTVTRDQLIGKAFFVYWPSGQRIDWLPALGKYGIIPDVGRMRWIR